MGIRVIGQKKFEVTETELLQQDLLFYLDNPRVYSVLHENGHDNPTQTEIEEIMCSLDHVKSLKSQIMQNGGLIEPLIVVKRKDRYVVLEGNSRLAAYRILAKNDPLKWSRVLVQILPEDISDSDIFTLLGTFHLNPKKDWSKFEQAAYIYRQKKELGCSDSALGKQVGISAITVKKYCEIYGLMVEHNDTHQSHWNMYEQYVQNKGIKQYRNTYPEMDSFFAKQVKTGEIVRAQDVRDRIRKINDSISDINFVPFYSGEKVTAMLWYAETNFLGTVLDKDIKGIRIRQGNILIGDENTLRKCYKEERFNSWMVGELLVFNEDIIPNTRRDDYEKNSAYKELLSQFTEWANEMSRQIRHRSYERSLTQSDKKFLSDESVTDVDGVDISLGTELDSYDMDDSDSVANTDLLSKLSLLMDMGKKKTKYNVLNLNSKFTVDQKQTLEHVFDALYAKYTNAKANDIIQTIIDSF